MKEPAHHSQIWAWRLNHQRNLRRRFQTSLKRMWRSCIVQSKSSWWQSKFLGLSRLRWPGTATRLWRYLACRWTTADLARTQSPTDLKFKDGENGFDQQGSNFTAMRIYQAVLQAKHMFQSGLTSGGFGGGFEIQLGCPV